MYLSDPGCLRALDRFLFIGGVRGLDGLRLFDESGFSGAVGAAGGPWFFSALDDPGCV